MSIRMAIIAIAATASAAVAVAQPGQDEEAAKAPKPVAAAPVVLASASDVRRPSPADAQRLPEPGRRPAPRVTTCRCGDPQPDDSQPDD